MSNNNLYSLIEIEKQGGYEGEYFCYYKYKPECEPEANKIRWTNPKDRWYEDDMTQRTIQNAIDDGVEFIDKKHEYKWFNCDHEWIDVGYSKVCNKCGVDIRNV